MKLTILMLLLIAPLAGCKKALDVYESKAPAVLVSSTNTNGTVSLELRTLSSDLTLVTGIVQRVDLPLLNSPSVAGDKATCILSVPADSIPAHPDYSKVALHYDNHGWFQALKPGMHLVLAFRKSGEFGGMQFPANFIQTNGAANQ